MGEEVCGTAGDTAGPTLSGVCVCVCTQLEKTAVRGEFCRSIDEWLRETEPLLSAEDTMDQKWSSISSVLYQSAAHSIGYRGRKHQDWFDDNSDTITAFTGQYEQRAQGYSQQPHISYPLQAMACITQGSANNLASS